MKKLASKKQSEQYHPMEVASEDRAVALARSAEVKKLISDFLQARERIPTGLKLKKEYDKAKKLILKVLGGTEKDWKNHRWHLKNRIQNVDTLRKLVRLSQKEMGEPD